MEATYRDTAFVLIDLDNIGYEIAKLISKNSVRDVKHLSNLITNLLLSIEKKLSDKYGNKLEIIYESGDNMLLMIESYNIEKTALEIADIVDKEISKIGIGYQIHASIGTSDKLKYIPVAISIAKLKIRELSKKINEKTSLAIVTSNLYTEIIKKLLKYLINSLKVNIEKIQTLDTILEIEQIYIISKILRLLHKIDKQPIENTIIRNIV
ncbi:MAG: hypothetical protein GXO23_02570 [Crenarchaeota archaeon]|nr:hypothetical protein [Thermoproteota archaeon]